ncbi:hypothetical protein [Arenibaculum pallidiluteum]|uniref:hypothetical protein n=1 Tax=Arenibaculum pallidiluteum TaxID=2812559 RepID=UPI001A97056B|nr:hypothetical protein [Arenibaculum pallidiluteum]
MVSRPGPGVISPWDATLTTLRAAVAPGCATGAKAAAARHEALGERTAEAAQALETLRAAPRKTAEDRKAEARAKLDRLKEQMRTLRMFAASDPELVARQARQLARELASAARAYAAAGGTDGGAAMGAGVAAAGGQVTAPAETQVSGTVPQAAGSGVADAAGPLAPPAARDDGQPETAPSASAPASAEGTAPQGASAPDRANRDDGKRAEDGGTEDEDFIREAKRLASELKTVLHQQAERIRAKSGGSSPEARELEAAAAQAEKAVSEAERQLRAAAFPALSIMA